MTNSKAVADVQYLPALKTRSKIEIKNVQSTVETSKNVLNFNSILKGLTDKGIH